MIRLLVWIAVLGLPPMAFGQSRVATPTFSIEGGEYSTVVLVTVEVSTPGATIRFTQNGIDPTESDPIIVSGSKVAINTSLILKARAYLSGRRPSEVRTAAYTIVGLDTRLRIGPGDVAAGGSRSLLAAPEGLVFEWVRDQRPELMAHIANVVFVAVGNGHALAATKDGAVFGWGRNNAGQLGDGSHSRRKKPVRARGLANVVRIAAGGAHSLALTADGDVWAWGSNNHGQLGIASPKHSSAPVKVSSLSGVVAIDAGDAHSVAVTRSGQVYTWGANNHGQLGDGTRKDRRHPVPIALTNAVEVAAGATHTLALSQDGSVHSWGSGSRGELGTGSFESATQPAAINNLQAFAVRAGRHFSAAVARDGALMTWGANDSGQLGDGTQVDRPSPVTGPSITSISALALGTRHGLVVSASGDVWTWGSNSPLAETMSDVANWGPPFLPEVLAAPVIQPASGSYPAPQSVTLTAGGEGVSVRYTLDGSEPTADSALYSEPLVVSVTSEIRARAFSSRPDVAPSEVSSASYVIDMVAPTIAIETSPSLTTEWVTTPITVTFHCADDSGTVSCPSTQVVSSDGAQQLVTGTAIDPAGNRATASITVNVDLTPPIVLLVDSPDATSTDAPQLVLTGRAFDSASGLADAVRCNGVPVTVTQEMFECPVTLQPGVNSVTLQAADLAGHVTAAGIVVTRVGEATRLAISPESRTMALNEVARVSLTDDFGTSIVGATWSSNDPTVVSLSADDPPVVTAKAEGTTTISASKNGLVAEASIVVVGSATLLPGTTRWELAPTPGLTMDMPVFTHLVDPTVPDMFAVETATRESATLRAVTAEGEVLWQQHSPGPPLMGDSFGGVISGVYADGSWDYRAYVRLGHAGGVTPWRYDSPGTLGRPAQAPDGTIYAIETIRSSQIQNVWDKHAVVMDGRTGRVLTRRLLDREVDVFTAELDGQLIREKPRLVCTSSRRETAPPTVGPVVGSDGRGYLLVRRLSKHKFDTCLEQHSRHRRSIEHGIDLLILSGDDEAVVQPLFGEACNVAAFEVAPCDVTPQLLQLLPDGVGGMMASWDRFGQFASTTMAVLQRVVTRRSEAGELVDMPVDNTTWIDTVGQSGISYIYASGAWSAVDVSTWVPTWTASLGTSGPLAAHPDGGLSIFDHVTRTHRVIDSSGNIRPEAEMPLPLRWPMQEFGSWIGLSTHGLTSIVGRLDDATRWAGFWGNRQGQASPRRPGIGVFAKAHTLLGFFPFLHHMSLRITPDDATYWVNHPRFGKYFREYVDEQGNGLPARDVYGNPSATLGAGPYGPNGEDTTSYCLANSILESKPNRPSDQVIPPIFWRNLTLRGSSNLFIERLFDLDEKYGDFLKYECAPDDPDEFNSNSFISGLLSAADIAKPFFPQQFPVLFPGWSKPVPATYFGQ